MRNLFPNDLTASVSFQLCLHVVHNYSYWISHSSIYHNKFTIKLMTGGIMIFEVEADTSSRNVGNRLGYTSTLCNMLEYRGLLLQVSERLQSRTKHMTGGFVRT